eukprot:TRINITY_DN23515_c0_g2_i1.p1 TRINITY_DN23515_c0_g2~~TRINITY_DN23515_c0_g2_i1.p1  ORF type:complete len:572 (-),score=65.13 TRINITY_DN23515_c0_g2_i1:309-2024(-)
MLMLHFFVLQLVFQRGSAEQPNILFILADDLGYNELGFMNSSRGIKTPHLDALANTGVILKNYYVQPICSPTRSALMTGRYTVRLGTQSNVIYWDTPWGVPLNETFVAQNLQDVGYRTALFGKWHLGMFKESYTPMKRGFHEHMGYYQGCESEYTHDAACCSAGSPDHDMNFVCNRNTKDSGYVGYDWFRSGPFPNDGFSKPDYTANHTSSATLITQAAVDFLRRNANSESTTPWFLFLPFQNVHAPYTCDPVFRQRYSVGAFSDGERTMFGYISEMDDAVGKVIAQLKTSPKQYDNTVIIFSSDNGAPPASPDVNHQVGTNPGWIARNYPFRGYKGLIWEGGTRVAGFVHSALLPEAVRGSSSLEFYHVTDWLPTIVSLAKGSTERNFKLDGYDIWASLSRGSASPRKEMLYNVNPLRSGQAGSPKAGIRVGDYKVLCWSYSVFGIDGATSTGPCKPCPGASDPELAKGPALFNLREDPAETTNLAEKEPAKLEQLLQRLKEFAVQSVEPQQWVPPYQGETYYCKTCPLHPHGKGPARPWLPWCQDNGESHSEPCKPLEQVDSAVSSVVV